MAITHANTAATGGTGTAAQWNADHVIGAEDKPKVPVTFVVAASDSVDATRADYVCDGIDDDEQINDALAALPLAGGKVTLLEGTYQLGARIQIDANYQTLEGQGYGTLLNVGGNFEGIYASGRIGLKIRDLCIQGGTGGGASQRGIYLLNCILSEVRNVWVDFCQADGILIVGPAALTLYISVVKECLVTGCALSGIVVSTGNCIVTDCIVIWSGERGIIFASSGGAVLGCAAFNNSMVGLLLSGLTSGVRVAENEMTRNNTDGILVQDFASDCIISGNWCSLNAGDGLKITTAGSKNIVVANRLQSLVPGGISTEYGHNVVG